MKLRNGRNKIQKKRINFHNFDENTENETDALLLLAPLAAVHSLLHRRKPLIINWLKTLFPTYMFQMQINDSDKNKSPWHSLEEGLK